MSHAERTAAKGALALVTIPYISQRGESRFVVGPSGIFSPRGLTPLRRVDRRKHGVPFRSGMHVSDFEACSPVDGLRIYVGAAANHDGRGAPPQRVTFRYLHRRFQARRHHDPGCSEIRISRDDDVGAVLQGLAERKESPAPHHDRMTDGQCAKSLEIGLEPPWQTTGAPNNAVLRNSGDEDQRKMCATALRHTATFALMCGWGS